MNTLTQYEINLSEEKLTEILENKSIKYIFNPKNQYELLDKGDQNALKHLVKAAKCLNEVFLKQDQLNNTQMRDLLLEEAKKGNSHAQKTLLLFEIFNGIEGHDGIKKDPIYLFKNCPVFPNKNIYPHDLTKEELTTYLKNNIEQAASILSNDTVVIRENNRLTAIPYAIYFRSEMEQAAKELLLAARETTHEKFRMFLQLQAQALVSTDPEFSYKADEIWANLEDSPLEFTIGKESYSDILSGSVLEDRELAELLDQNGIRSKAKDFLGARVGIVDIQASREIRDYRAYLKEISQHMPLNEQYRQSTDNQNNSAIKQNLSDIDLVYLSGDYSACRPGITLAQNLPNDDKLSVQLNAGNKNVFHKQIRQTRDPENLKKLLENLVVESLHPFYHKESDHLFTINHELSHSLGPSSTKTGRDKKISLGSNLGDIIEEAKADLGALLCTWYFNKIAKYDDETTKKILVTWSVDQMPLSQPPEDQAHRMREIMQLNYFREFGAIVLEKEGKLNLARMDNGDIDTTLFFKIAKEMLQKIIQIQLDGNPAQAKDFVNKYAQWNDALEYVSHIKQTKLKVKPYKILIMPLAWELLDEDRSYYSNQMVAFGTQ